MTVHKWERAIGTLLKPILGQNVPADFVNKPWAELGLTSRDAISLSADLERQYSVELSATAAWSFPTPHALAAHLAGALDADAPGTVRPAGSPDAIAVVGLACRFPGADAGRDAFWSLLADGRDAIQAVPAERWRAWGLSDQELDLVSAEPIWGGLLEDIQGFDTEFFGIPPSQAAAMDPQQRMLLEVAYDALLDAGISATQLAGSATGVFVGTSCHEFSSVVGRDLAGVDAWTGTGASAAILSNRLSYQWNLMGPSLTIDTACSSSLSALHLACTSLRNGECEQALVGGVNALLSPAATLGFLRVGAMAPDGRCKVFDASADGYVRSEGCGVLVLKPLQRALREGNHVWGVVRGTAVNAGGRGNGLMAPRAAGQSAVIRQCLTAAGVSPGEVDYVECHGTGTVVGDPIEVEALAAVYGSGRTTETPLRVGSVKTNVGHLEGAAGIAGVIKVLLSMRHQTLPASLHYAEPSPLIDFSHVAVVEDAIPWPYKDHPRLAAVSSFGFGGSNAHAILEEAPSGGTDEDQAWVFSGQASRWPGMGADLLEERAFLQALRRLDPVIHAESGFAVEPMLRAKLLPSGVAEVQPTLYALQIALADLLLARGARPAFVVGHSMGEVAASVVAGILGPEDGARLICRRARLLASLEGDSGMAVVGAPRTAIEKALWALDGVGIAAENAPTSFVISGPRQELNTTIERLEASGHRCHLVDVDVASHSPVVEPVLQSLRSAAASLDTRPGIIPLVSTVEGSHPDQGASHWVANLRQPVRFGGAVEECLRLGVRTFVEVSPHPALLDAVVEIAGTRPVSVYAALRRGRRGLLPGGRAWRREPLPSRRWAPAPTTPAPSRHTLLGSACDVGLSRPVRVWRAALSSTNLPYPQEHRVAGSSFVPASVIVATLFAATENGAGLRNVVLNTPLQADREQGITVACDANEVVLTAAALSGDSDADTLRIASASIASGAALPAADLRQSSEPESWWGPPPTNASAYPGAILGWFREKETVWVQAKLGDSPSERRTTLLDVAMTLPSLASGGIRVPFSVAHAQLATDLPDTVVLRYDPTVPNQGNVRAGSRGREMLRLDGLETATIFEASAARVSWEPSVLDVSGAEVWLPAMRADESVLEASVRLIAEARGHILSCSGSSPLAIVTRGVREGTDDSLPLAALWGLANVLAAEHPDLWRGIVDVSGSTSVAGEVTGFTRQTGPFGQFSQSLRPTAMPSRTEAYDPTGPVLITGASGGIGSLLAPHLVAQGANQLVLASRHGVSPDLVHRLELAGAKVWAPTIDLTEPGALSAYIHRWREQTGLRLATIIHAAATVRDAPMASLTSGDVGATLAVKVAAVDELATIAAESQSQRAVAFSSAAALRGVPGQASYAAGNALMAERVLRLAACEPRWRVIHWGPWDNVGLGSGPRAEFAKAASAEEGCAPITPEAGLAVIDAALTWDVFDELAVFGERIATTIAGSVSWQLARAPERERLIRDLIAARLSRPADEIQPNQPLASYGLDSILSLRIRQDIEQAVGTPIPPTFLWNYTTIAEICSALGSPDLATPTAHAPKSGPGFNAILSQIEATQ